ncbi:MAG: hypothetical protein JNJ85_02815 [Candidatus Kapabacteria bacterium]|nr:hypothetical protein [Candidatus Kapabacteria bacterium]
MSKAFWIAATLSAVVSFLIGGILHGVVLESYLQGYAFVHYKGLMKDTPDYILIFLGNAGIACMMTYVFNQWAHVRSAMQGIKTAIIISAPMSIGADITFYGIMNIYNGPLPLFINVIASIVISAGAGAAAGWALGKFSNN